MMAAVAPSSVLSKDTSPRKKKAQISFAHSSFNKPINNQNGSSSNNQAAEDIQFLYTQLQKVKADNDKLLERNALLENQLSDILMRFNESSARRKIEEQTFRRILKNEKLSFDKKLAQKVMKLKERDQIINAWLKAVTENELDKKHTFLNDLCFKSKSLFAPKKKKNESGTKPPKKTKDETKSAPPHQGGDGIGEDYQNEDAMDDDDGDAALSGEEENNDNNKRKGDSEYVDTDFSDYPGTESDANSKSRAEKKPFRSRDRIVEGDSETDLPGKHMKLGSMLESKDVGETEVDTSPAPVKDVSLNESLMQDIMFDSDEGSLAEMDDFLTHSSTVQSELNLINRLLEGVASAKGKGKGGRPQRNAGQGRPHGSTADSGDTAERVVYTPQPTKKDILSKELSYKQIIEDIIHPVEKKNDLEMPSTASQKIREQASLLNSILSSPESSMFSLSVGSSLIVPTLGPPAQARLSTKGSSRPDEIRTATDSPSKVREIDFVLQTNQESGKVPRLVPASRESDTYSEDFESSRNNSRQHPQKAEDDLIGGPAFNRNNIRESIQQIEKNIEMLKLGGELDDAEVFNVDFD